MGTAIGIERAVAAQLTDLARENPAEECCGLLAGDNGVITRVLAAINVAENPATQYEIAAEELFRLMREIRAEQLEMLGIYHSHPSGANVPSPTDLSRAYYPEAAYFILSPRADQPKMIRVFSIREGRATEIEPRII
jgi:proteasome lid subunit RPN8/RPN11